VLTDQKILCTGCGEIKYERLLKGQKFKVLGVHINHPDFSTQINLETAAGEFQEHDYTLDNNIFPDKQVVNPFLKTMGSLMDYPAILLTSSIFR